MQNNAISQFVARQPKRRLLVACLVVVFAVIIGLVVYSRQFRVISTDPPISSFATYAPVLYVDFNQPLTGKGLTVTSTPSVTPSFSVNGTRLTIKLDPSLQTGQSYTISLHNIRSTTGAVMTSQTFTFTAQDIAFDQLSSEMQLLLNKSQDQFTPSRNTIVFSGTDALVNQGVTTQQIDAMEQAVFLYGKSINKTFKEVVIDPSTVQAAPVDPNHPATYFTVTFTVTIDNTAYMAELQYTNLSVARLILDNPTTHAIIYDSGNIDDATLD